LVPVSPFAAFNEGDCDYLDEGAVKLTHKWIPTTGRRVYTLYIDDLDIVRAKFQPWDFAVLADCGKDDRTVADRLLALELIARRIEEGI